MEGHTHRRLFMMSLLALGVFVKIIFVPRNHDIINGSADIVQHASIISPRQKDIDTTREEIIEGLRSKGTKTKNAAIILMVMGKATSFPIWVDAFQDIRNVSLSILYASYDEEIQQNECYSRSNFLEGKGFNCETIFIPGATWSKGRNKLAEKAVKKEQKRGETFDWWVFLDGDVHMMCEVDTSRKGQCLFGRNTGLCWQRAINFMISDLIPKSVTSLFAPHSAIHGFASTSFPPHMLSAFKREYIPYFLPYADVPVDGSELLAQAVLQCLTKSYFPQSALHLPNITMDNPFLSQRHFRHFTRVKFLPMIESIFHNESTTELFNISLPCQNMFNRSHEIQNRWPSLNSDVTTIVKTKEEFIKIIPKAMFSKETDQLKYRYLNWEQGIINDVMVEDKETVTETAMSIISPPPREDEHHEMAKSINTNDGSSRSIIIMVMGEANFFPKWNNEFITIHNVSLSFVYASYDTEIEQDQCQYCSNFPENENFHCETIYIPNTGWTEGRNKLAERAVEKEYARGKMYDWWVFLDDDIDVTCDPSAYLVEDTIADKMGSCWQKVINFMISDHIPEGVTTLHSDGHNIRGFASTSFADAMMNAFKREYVPYYLPYAKVFKGSSEWLSQAVVQCLTKSYFPQSVLHIPYASTANPAHRAYARDGFFRSYFVQMIEHLFQNETATEPLNFSLPCQDMFIDTRIIGERWPILNSDLTMEVNTKEELEGIIPKAVFSKETAQLKYRFMHWEQGIIKKVMI